MKKRYCLLLTIILIQFISSVCFSESLDEDNSHFDILDTKKLGVDGQPTKKSNPKMSLNISEQFLNGFKSNFKSGFKNKLDSGYSPQIKGSEFQATQFNSEFHSEFHSEFQSEFHADAFNDGNGENINKEATNLLININKEATNHKK